MEEERGGRALALAPPPLDRGGREVEVELELELSPGLLPGDFCPDTFKEEVAPLLD